MIRGSITFSGPHAQIVQQSLAPDNLPSMRIEKQDGEVVVHFEVDKIGTLLSTVDDYLMNAKIAEDLCKIKK
jgi:hypothetical protein